MGGLPKEKKRNITVLEETHILGKLDTNSMNKMA